MSPLKICCLAAFLLAGCGEPVPGAGPVVEVHLGVRDMGATMPAVHVIDATLTADTNPRPPDSFQVEQVPIPAHVDPAHEIEEPPTCETLVCDDVSVCREDAFGRARCVDLTCDTDRDCPVDQHCDGRCVPDVCVADTTLCDPDGVTLMRCASNGADTEVVRFCGGDDTGVFSACAQVEDGEAKCTCSDDWDCPAHFACEQGLCQGTGQAPSCLLAPVPFDPSGLRQELVWGGNVVTDVHAERVADTGPWPTSSQSVSTPLVVNLDDDNGDGQVDALDFPEIIFMTYTDSRYDRQGILRAIHGGGPKKGQDLFATCGHQTWHQGEPLPEEGRCLGDLSSSSGLAIGDLDDPLTSDGRPEIVAISDDRRLVIYDNLGNRLYASPKRLPGDRDLTPSLANLDNQGMAEIIVGKTVFVLTIDDLGRPVVRDHFEGNRGRGRNGNIGLISCVADLFGGPELEIVGGGTVYGLPVGPAGAQSRADCVGAGGDLIPETEHEIAFCEGRLWIHWDAAYVAAQAENQGGEEPENIPVLDGFCAVADVWGAQFDTRPGLDNPLDGRPEIVLISENSLLVLDGETGVQIYAEPLRYQGNGGAPNVDDFDGDGFPEVGSAGGRRYAVVDFQAPTPECTLWDHTIDDRDQVTRAPGGLCASDDDCVPGAGVCNPGTGRCVCLHNSWRHETEDNSSQATGSTLFDFNGDGATEVIYNDECWFRIFDGLTGEVLFEEPSESRTRIEHPIVADADNDGNAELIFATNTESGHCDSRSRPDADGVRPVDRYNYGIEMWGDAADRWVPSRRIWNQHAYHVTHIREDGSIPTEEVRGWRLVNGRRFNAYRAQPRSAGIAPDLTIPQATVRSAAGACSALGDHLVIDALVANEGDVRVGRGIRVGFMGQWGDDEWELLVDPLGTPIQVVVESTIEPGRTASVTADYRLADNPSGRLNLPDRVRITADVGGEHDFGVERECNESNNSTEVEVRDPGNLPDLAVDTVTVQALLCPSIEMTVTFTNVGAAHAENPTVAFYAGDPEQGGFRLASTGYAGVIEPGEQVSVTTSTAKLSLSHPVRVYAVVDHIRQITECDEGNNVGRTEEVVRCLNN